MNVVERDCGDGLAGGRDRVRDLLGGRAIGADHQRGSDIRVVSEPDQLRGMSTAIIAVLATTVARGEQHCSRNTGGNTRGRARDQPIEPEHQDVIANAATAIVTTIAGERGLAANRQRSSWADLQRRSA